MPTTWALPSGALRTLSFAVSTSNSGCTGAADTAATPTGVATHTTGPGASGLTCISMAIGPETAALDIEAAVDATTSSSSSALQIEFSSVTTLSAIAPIASCARRRLVTQSTHTLSTFHRGRDPSTGWRCRSARNPPAPAGSARTRVPGSLADSLQLG